VPFLLKEKVLFTRIHLRIVVLGVALATATGFCAQAQSPWQAAPQAATAPMVVQTPTPPPTQQAPVASPLMQRPTPRPGTPALAPRARKNQVFEEKSGTIVTKDGQRLHLETDIGSVRVFTDGANEVRFRVRIETEDTGAEARRIVNEFSIHSREAAGGVTIQGDVPRRELRDRLWVTYELHVPRNYNLDVNTQAGNIQVDDIDGRVSLITNGGNITAGQVGGATRLTGLPAARLESLGGGHISVRNVSGDLRAVTVGGHITTGDVMGDAVLTTGGGHIHAGKIAGVAQLETGGGNITVVSAGSRVTASSGGGQISFGQAAGAIQAKAAGGGIRVLRVAGPMQLDSSGGSIFLTDVQNSVRATTTGTGSITAWLAPSLKFNPGSQLESGQGDIIVYLPRDLHLTVQATIDSGGGHHIVTDPSMPMKVSYVTSDSGKQERGECPLNGGGEVLHLRALDGNIQLRFADEFHLRQQKLMTQHIQQDIEIDQRLFQTLVQQSVQQSVEEMKNQVQQAQKAYEAAQQSDGNYLYVQQDPTPKATQVRNPPTVPPGTRPTPAPPAPPETEILWMKLGELWWGGVPVDAGEQQKRLIRGVPPVYPDVARQAGIAGTVSLRVLIGKGGDVVKIDVLSGEQSLQQAAVNAVRQWRYRQYMLDGKPVPVLTTVNLEFRLQ
jgi:TonB family protein